MAKCYNCNYDIPSDASFCGVCGAKINLVEEKPKTKKKSKFKIFGFLSFFLLFAIIFYLLFNNFIGEKKLKCEKKSTLENYDCEITYNYRVVNGKLEEYVFTNTANLNSDQHSENWDLALSLMAEEYNNDVKGKFNDCNGINTSLKIDKLRYLISMSVNINFDKLEQDDLEDLDLDTVDMEKLIDVSKLKSNLEEQGFTCEYVK